MFSDENSKAVTLLIVTAVGAGCALIGLLADSTNANPITDNIKTAWVYGDEMAAEFMRRGLALSAQEKSNG